MNCTPEDVLDNDDGKFKHHEDPYYKGDPRNKNKLYDPNHQDSDSHGDDKHHKDPYHKGDPRN